MRIHISAWIPEQLYKEFEKDRKSVLKPNGKCLSQYCHLTNILREKYENGETNSTGKNEIGDFARPNKRLDKKTGIIDDLDSEVEGT